MQNLFGKAKLVRISLSCKSQPGETQHFFELSFLCKPRDKSLNFLSFGRQKQTPLFNISLVSFVCRAVLMRK